MKIKSSLHFSTLVTITIFLTVGCVMSLIHVQNFFKNPISQPELNKKSPFIYTTSNGLIYNHDEKIYLHGVSWFGFEDDGLLAHGIWQRSMSDIVTQIKKIGFNAVRLPFCPPILQNPKVKSIDYSKNPDLVGKGSLEVMDAVIRELDRQEVHVLLDLHNFDCTNNLYPLWYTDAYPESQWLADWSFVVDRYKEVGYVVGADIKNEPHDENGVYAQWGNGDSKTDWKLAAERAGETLLKINPNILIFVQGIGDMQADCSDKYGHFWGGNFEPVRCHAVDSARLPPNKIVYTPHVYGPDVDSKQEYFADKNYPNNLPAIWDKHFGFLIEKGYTVSIGEFGGKYGHDDKYGKSDKPDKIWQDKFVDYLIEKKICNYFYWSLNPDSDDTGGILQADWQTPHQDKLDNLKRLNSSCK
jgi:endoglucanase